MEETPGVLSITMNPGVVGFGSLPGLVMDGDADYLKGVLVVCEMAD
jgi:hypothetical protein